MTDAPNIIENRIRELRALMRDTLDRSKLSLMREELMTEIAKLRALGGQDGDTDHHGRS